MGNNCIGHYLGEGYIYCYKCPDEPNCRKLTEENREKLLAKRKN